MSIQILTGESFYDSHKKIWSGKNIIPKYGPNNSIGSVVLEALLGAPEHIAQICYHNDKQYTNGEIATLIIRVAQHFKELNLEQCDVVGLCAVNSDYVAPLFLGGILAGLTISTLDPSFDKDGIKHIFSITKPRIMFCDGSVYEKIVEAFEEIDLNIPIYTMKDHRAGVSEITEFLQETGLERTFKPEALKFGPSQTAAILPSSGTTGLPKGVCMSHSTLLNGQVFSLGHTDKILCFSTLYWASGLMVLLSGSMQGATRVISEKGYSPEIFFDIIEKYKVNILFTPPSQIAMSIGSSKIHNFDLSSVTHYISGGSAIPYSLIEKMAPYMPNAKFFVGYGMSEVCGAISVGLIAPGSCGQLIQNTKAKIIDDNGIHLEPEKQGEVCVNIPFPWAGYYGNPEATEAIYEKDGWIHSGDIGYFDKEGNLYIVDRKKDILKYNNFHFFPTEIEEVISEITDVTEVCVCGIPDIVSGHLPAAAIVKSANSTLCEEEVCKYVADRMAHFKHLRGGVYFVNHVPKTASGKNLRRKIVEICESLKEERDTVRMAGKIAIQQNRIKV